MYIYIYTRTYIYIYIYIFIYKYINFAFFDLSQHIHTLLHTGHIGFTFI